MLNIVTDSYADTSQPRSELLISSDGNLSDNTSSSIDFMVESESELPVDTSHQYSPVLTATPLPRRASESFVIVNEASTADGASVRFSSGSGRAPAASAQTTDPTAPNGLLRYSYLNEQLGADSNELNRIRAHLFSLVNPDIYVSQRINEIDARLAEPRYGYRFSDYATSTQSGVSQTHNRTPTSPTNSILTTGRGIQNSPQSYSVQVINSDGYILSVAAPSPRTSRNYVRRSGIPLRRLNAIRIKRDDYSGAMEPVEKIEALHQDFLNLLNCIDRNALFARKLTFSAIFTNYTSSHATDPSSHHQETPVEQLDYLVNDRIHYSADLLRTLELSHEIEKTKINLHKRSADGQIFRANKRRKLKKQVDVVTTKSISLQDFSNLYQDVDIKHVPLSTQNQIMDGLFSSFISAGSKFNFESVCNSRKRLSMNLQLSYVDYEKKKLHGFFSNGGGQNKNHAVTNLKNFLAYLGGIEIQEKLSHQSYFRRRICLLNEMLSVCSKTGKMDAVATVAQAVRFTFSGDLIDFQTNDFRFLHKVYEGNGSANHVLQGPIKDAEFALLQWLRIEPFSHFAEARFYASLVGIEAYLKKALLDANEHQNCDLRYILGFRRLIHEICKTYGFIKGTEIPFECDEYESRRIDANFRKSLFFTLWEKKQDHEFCDHFTENRQDLTNIQLNYVLLTLELDVVQTLDEIFAKSLPLLSEEDRSKYSQEYMELDVPRDFSTARKVVFVCSVHRGTGEFQLHNTRPSFEYKFFDFMDQMQYKDRRDPLYRYYTSMLGRLGSKLALQDPDSAKVRTILIGSWVRESGASTASDKDSICGSYSVA